MRDNEKLRLVVPYENTKSVGCGYSLKAVFCGAGVPAKDGGHSCESLEGCSLHNKPVM